MHKGAFVLACLAFACHGRRLQISTDRVQNSPHTESKTLWKVADAIQTHARVSTKGAGNPMRVLTRLLLLDRPAAAFNPSNAAAYAGMPKSTLAAPQPVILNRFGSAPLMSMSDQVSNAEAKDTSKVASELSVGRNVLLGALGAAIAFAPTAAFAGDMTNAIQATEATSTLLAFADQAGNLAGPLFANSLFPYLTFLYFMRQDVNGLSPVAKGGFTFLLAFVAATVVTSIYSTKTFDLTLANSDWLHGGAEQLLALTNIVNVIGLKLTLDAFESGEVTQPAEPDQLKDDGLEPKAVGLAAIAAATACAITYFADGGILLGHDAYLGGLGNLPEDLLSLSEPVNALSLPTWVIHASSLLEWLVAMGLVWRLSLVSGNPRWKGLTWAMIPSHSSGICACVYHIFYNQQQWIVLSQSALTFIGNCCLAFASYRLAVSNGWEFSLPFSGGADKDSDTEEIAPEEEDVPAVAASNGLPFSFSFPFFGGDDNDLSAEEEEDPLPPLSGGVEREEIVPLEGNLDITKGLGIVFAWSLLASYLVKYGGAALSITSDAPDWLALLLIVGPTAFNVYKWNERSQVRADFGGLI